MSPRPIALRSACCWAVSVCVIPACVSARESTYLTGAEIQESIIGKSLKGSDPWKEHYVRAGGNERAGDIRGRSSEGPYKGRWSIKENLWCVTYPETPDNDGCYRLAKEAESRILWFDEAGALAFESELTGGDQGPSPAFGPVPALRQETVRFDHGQDSLLADLSLPEGSGPHPAVLFVHGSGAVSRHWFSYEPIRNEFLRRGFATMIWSKPGIDESTGDFMKQSMAQRAGEVAAAMALLGQRSDIDAGRIGLWGISQAGWVIPMVPAHGRVAFVICVSCPVGTGLEQSLYLADNELKGIGVPDDERADAREHLRRLLVTMGTGVDYEEFLEDHREWLAEVRQRPWYPAVETHLDEALMFEHLVPTIDRRWFGYLATVFVSDAAPQLKNLQMPVLAIYGSQDTFVDWRLGVRAYEEIPRSAGNPEVTVKLFEGADHGIAQPDSEGYRDFAPGFLTMMGEWLAERR